MEKEMGEQVCEICKSDLPADPFADCVCRNRQDAIWYANGGQAELVCIVEGTRLSIERCGYTRFIYFPADAEGERYELCNTSDFEKWGIEDDTELMRLWDSNHLEIDQSPWFEIYDRQARKYLDEVTFTGLDEVYAFVLGLPESERNWE